MASPEEDEPEDQRLDLARDVTDRFKKGDPQSARGRRRPRGSLPTGRRGQREDPIFVSDALGELIRQQGWGPQLDAERVLSDWASIVGSEVAQHSEVVGFAESVVHVRTTSTAWATQMRLLAPRIVAKLNEQLGDGTVLRIQIDGPQAPSWKKGPRSVRGRGPRDTYG